MSKVRVDIEFCKALREMRGVINRLKFSDIEWFENGKKKRIHKHIAERFSFTGLSNMDFLLFLENKVTIMRGYKTANRKKKK